MMEMWMWRKMIKTNWTERKSNESPKINIEKESNE